MPYPLSLGGSVSSTVVSRRRLLSEPALPLLSLAFVGLLSLAAGCTGSEGGGPMPGMSAQPTVRIRVTDRHTGEVTPARIEVLNSLGSAVIPNGALLIEGECDRPSHVGNRFERHTQRGVFSPLASTLHFYTSEPLDISLEPGRYRVTVQKGFEYERVVLDIELQSGEHRTLDVPLSRWANMPASGWFSADAHLHIPRGDPADASLLAWMRAEDLNVANLLQMGDYSGIVAARQESFGLASVARQGDTLIASGQENPRTWILGHGIVLGAESYIDLPTQYLAYDQFWREAKTDGAVVGYAHFKAPGLWTDAPTGDIDFLEVFQFGIAQPEALYDLLNLGIRIAPSAGTDFPCFPSGPPGSERFYTRVQGPLTYQNWLDGLKAGRTFVSNGPLLEFSIEDVGIGGDLRLPASGNSVRIAAAVRFDPARDNVSRLELIQGGDLVYAEDERLAPGLIQLDLQLPVAMTTWFAVRATGTKVTSPEFLSAAHSGAIYVEVANTSSLDTQEPARRVADRALSELDDLARRFDEDSLRAIRTPFAEALLGIPAEVGLRDRAIVLERIGAVREFYENIAHPPWQRRFARQ